MADRTAPGRRRRGCGAARLPVPAARAARGDPAHLSSPGQARRSLTGGVIREDLILAAAPESQARWCITAWWRGTARGSFFDVAVVQCVLGLTSRRSRAARKEESAAPTWPNCIKARSMVVSRRFAGGLPSPAYRRVSHVDWHFTPGRQEGNGKPGVTEVRFEAPDPRIGIASGTEPFRR